MPSYKIHSLKDNKKLSFIIEGESRSLVEQKLSAEGYIVLSVDETQVDESMIFFYFEGRKPDNSFISGKISAETIFHAHEMLTKEYLYILNKLYPMSITDPQEQEKIFSQLQYTFQAETIEKVETKKDTSQEKISRYKKYIQELIVFIQDSKLGEKSKEEIVSELKKADQTTNATTVEQILSDSIKRIYTETTDKKNGVENIKKIAKDLHIFLAPPTLLSTKRIFENIKEFIKPMMIKVKKEEIITQGKEAVSLKDPHINKLLRGEYRKNISYIKKQKIAFVYSLLREKQTLFLGKKVLTTCQKIATTGLFVIITIIILGVMLGYYPVFFFSGEKLAIFLIIIFSSLVFPDQAV